MELKRVTFSQSLCWWIKGSISIDARTVNADLRNTIFGIIPAGKTSESIPLSNISSCAMHRSYDARKMILSAVMILLSCVWLSMAKYSYDYVFLGIVFFLIGVVAALKSIVTALVIGKAGRNFVISVPFFEKNQIKEAADAINDMLIYTEDKKNVTANTDRIISENKQNTDRVISAINSNNSGDPQQ